MESHVLRRGPGRSPAHEKAEEVFRSAPNPTSRGGGVPGIKSQPGPAALERRRAFVRIINKRAPTAIDAITSIGTLANPKNYRWASSDIDKLEAALAEAVRTTIARFRKPDEAAPGFYLSDEEEGA